MQELDLKLIVPSALAGISLVVSLLVAIRNWGFSDTTVRYTARNQYMNALFDIDRQLIGRPELWAVYDGHAMAINRSNDAESRARREAFLYLHFNLFETVFTDYNRILIPGPSDSEFWDSWNAWMRAFFEGSSEARALFATATSQRIFSAGFVAHVNEIVRNAEKLDAPPTPGDGA